MTRQKLKKAIIIVIGLYMFALAAGIIIYYLDISKDKVHYQIFKDLMPLTIAIPAAYLGFCFQRRSSFLQALRQLWTHLITSVNAAIQYTHLVKTSEKQFKETLVLLSKSIDEVRGVYKNLGETNSSRGLYPFQDLREMHTVISDLGYKKINIEKASEARQRIIHYWKNLRKSFLTEFDRSEPTVFSTPFIDKSPKFSD